MNQRKHYSSEQKVLILRELLENNIPISHLAERFQVHVNDIYNWRKKLFENAKDIFQPKVSNLKHLSTEQSRIAKLESKLKDREEAIAFLVKENIDLKKSIDGEI